MPSLRRRPALRLLLAAVVASCAAVVWSALAQAEVKGIEVTVVRPDDSTETILTDEIANPEITTNYEVRDANGNERTIPIKGGVSIRQLLEETGTDLKYGTVEIDRPNGPGRVVLDRDDIESRLAPVLFTADDGSVRFLRPSTGSGDYNQRDYFKLPASTIRLEQTSPNLKVKVQATDTKINVGESITFTAVVSGGSSNASYEYDWNFDDGTDPLDDADRKVTHKFTKSGNYDVLASVRIAGSDRSDSGVADVEVGDPKKSAEDQEGGGSSSGASDSGTYGDTGSTYSGSSGSTATTTPSTPTPSADPPTSPSIATAGPTVSGNLLADVSSPTPSNILESAAKAAREGTPKDDDEADGATVPEAVFSVLALLVLLTLGAAMEERQDWRLRRAAKPVG